MSRKPIEYDWSNAQIDGSGLRSNALEKLAPALNQARDEVLRNDTRPGTVGFVELPDRLMTAYRHDGPRSDLGRILATAQRLRETVDCVILLGPGIYTVGAQAVMEACVHPYHNQLSRAERGGIPRLYFAGDPFDNDAVQALLDLLPKRTPSTTPIEPWAMIVIDDDTMGRQTVAAIRIFKRALQQHCGTTFSMADFVVPVVGKHGPLFGFANAIGCRDVFELPDGVSRSCSILSAAALVPAAALGINVVQLLEGARAMNEHFRSVPSGQNCVLQFAGVSHAMEKEHGSDVRMLSVWSKALEGVGRWYHELLADQLGKPGCYIAPGAEGDSGTHHRLITNVVLQEWRCDPIDIGRFGDQDALGRPDDGTFPELTAGAFASAERRNRENQRPSVTIRLPRLDENHLGQLVQMLMLATVVEEHMRDSITQA